MQILAALNAWRDEAELIAFLFGIFAAEFARIVVALHVDVAAFFAAKFSDPLIALFEIRTAAVSAPL